MRTSLAILSAILLHGSSSIFAQEQENDPLPENSGVTSPLPDETDAMDLIPDDPSETQRPMEYGGFGVQPPATMEMEEPQFEEIPIPIPIPTAEEEDLLIRENKEGKALQDRIKFFETRVKAMDDLEIQSEWNRANSVRTFPEQRQALFNYYTLLYARMQQLAPDLEGMILSQRDLDFAYLRQSAIKPSTWPVPPPDFPEPHWMENEDKSKD